MFLGHGMDWPFWIDLGGATADHCMGPLLSVVVPVLVVLNVAGYLAIGADWKAKERKSGNHSARMLRWVFIFCGIERSLLIVRLWIPVWSLDVLLLIVLDYLTWKYWRNRRDMLLLPVPGHLKAEEYREIADELEAANTQQRLGDLLSRLKDLSERDRHA